MRSIARCKLSRQAKPKGHTVLLYDYLVTATCAVADIALCGYTHVAEEGDFDLSAYPAGWLLRVAAHPGHSLITQA